MREQDAKVKVCPQLPRFCLASQCMAWRWFYALNQENTVTQNADFEDMQGYCGLAGDPRSTL